MAKLAIIAIIEVSAGRRAELVPRLMAHRQRCLKEEAGTLQFEVLLPNDDDSKVLLYELYQDVNAFEQHRNGASIAQFRAECSALIQSISGTRCALAE